MKFNPLIINRITYPKWKQTIGHGFDRRPAGRQPSSVVMHSTNGAVGSSSRAEGLYLYNSPNVSAHYFVDKFGLIFELLPPDIYRAWHAGYAIPGFGNADSIGIEAHHAPGEAWTDAQMQSISGLVIWLMEQHPLILPERIETHRRVALPPGRKVDPSDWLDVAFYAWRAGLNNWKPVPEIKHLTRYYTLVASNVRQGPSRQKPVALNGTAVWALGATFESDVTVRGESINGNDRWVHMVTPAPLGFIHSSCVKEAL